MIKLLIVMSVLFNLMLPNLVWGAGPIIPDNIQIENVQLYRQEAEGVVLWKLEIVYILKNDSGETDGVTKVFELSEKQKNNVRAFLGEFLRGLN